MFGPIAAVNAGTQKALLLGYIDRTGKLVIKPQFAEAGEFKGNLAPLKVGDGIDGLWGCIVR